MIYSGSLWVSNTATNILISQVITTEWVNMVNSEPLKPTIRFIYMLIGLRKINKMFKFSSSAKKKVFKYRNVYMSLF